MALAQSGWTPAVRQSATKPAYTAKTIEVDFNAGIPLSMSAAGEREYDGSAHDLGPCECETTGASEMHAMASRSRPRLPYRWVPVDSIRTMMQHFEPTASEGRLRARPAEACIAFGALIASSARCRTFPLPDSVDGHDVRRVPFWAVDIRSVWWL